MDKPISFCTNLLIFLDKSTYIYYASLFNAHSPVVAIGIAASLYPFSIEKRVTITTS